MAIWFNSITDRADDDMRPWMQMPFQSVAPVMGNTRIGIVDSGETAIDNPIPHYGRAFNSG